MKKLGATKFRFEVGDQGDVRRLWHDVLAECPDDREALAKLSPLRGHSRDALP